MNQFATEELEILSKFRLGLEQSSSTLSTEAKNLLNPEFLSGYLTEIQPRIHSDRLNVTGSMLIKRYAFLAAMALFSMTVFGKRINTSPENITIETDDEDPLWLPSFYFHTLECIPMEGSREKWRDELLADLFRNHLSRILGVVSKEARISKLILWENIVLYVVWMYDTLLENKPEYVTIEQIQDDYMYVVKEADGELFGDGMKNPFLQFYGKQKADEPKMRQTCCLYYLTSEKRDRCSTCPKHCLT
ncbi:IucA/IucC family C-terminal-domain containing protein [Metabacillus idriensis]|uniref:IucA/IucC family C-terminal-domain containing protein n=1 Tax=Metabacillus idriensis TaxID=324768 RepID=UPI001747F0DC|nr:IucA/IucC family C-terminal-domain containing protein [Metabacillus idriensis]